MNTDKAGAGSRLAAETLWITRVETPVGPMRISATDCAVTMAGFDEGVGAAELDALARRHGGQVVAGANAVAEQLAEELAAYFEGRLKAFGTPLAPRGTPFQHAAWRALRDIPYGQTVSYGTQARAIGRPAAVRAVAQANGANPIAIVVPCHRVIGADGTLTGYGGGLDRKRWLLQHEARHAMT